MMMPVYPGAPWLPKFKGAGSDLKYCDWKEQIRGLLGSQDLTEARKVNIVLGALSGEAKRQITVLNADEKDQTVKIFEYLDSLYGDQTPVPVLRSKFFGCSQGVEESVQSFILRLRELYSKLNRQDPDNAPSEVALKDQLLLGLCDGPLAQALKVYARHNPELQFSDLRGEALQLDTEYGHTRPEAICSSINKQYPSPRPTQDTNWKEQLKCEIMDDVKAHMKGLTQDIVAELKPLLQPASPHPASPNPSWNRRFSPRPYDRDEQGRPICHRCRKAGHIARYCRGAATPEPTLN